MPKQGDRVEIIKSGEPRLVGAIGTVVGESRHIGRFSVNVDGFDFRAEGFCIKTVACLPEELRKIDDDPDEIPANIRAIFTDKCDETLPTKVRVSK